MKNQSKITLKYNLILQQAINKQLLKQRQKEKKQMEYVASIALILIALSVPYVVIKKRKKWNKDDVEPIDNWKYPSNYM